MSKTMPATKFKANVLALLKQVARTGEKIVVTNRGKPMAELSPISPPKLAKNRYGGKIIGDIVSPLPDKWEADN
jgi:prevent-host-death family protein